MGANKSLHSRVKQHSSRVSAAQNTYCGPSSRIFHVCCRPVDTLALKLSVYPICPPIRCFLMNDRKIMTGKYQFSGQDTLLRKSPFFPFYPMDGTMKELPSWCNCVPGQSRMQLRCSQQSIHYCERQHARWQLFYPPETLTASCKSYFFIFILSALILLISSLLLHKIKRRLPHCKYRLLMSLINYKSCQTWLIETERSKIISITNSFSCCGHLDVPHPSVRQWCPFSNWK